MDAKETAWREAMAKRDRDYMERGLLMHFIGGPLNGKWSIGSDTSTPTLKFFPEAGSDLFGQEYYELWDIPTFYIWKGSQA